MAPNKGNITWIAADRSLSIKDLIQEYRSRRLTEYETQDKAKEEAAKLNKAYGKSGSKYSPFRVYRAEIYIQPLNQK